MVRASMDYHHKELGLKMEVDTHQNDAQLTKAKAQLAEAKAQHPKLMCACRHSCCLQQAHLNSVPALDWEMLAEEEWKHQAFSE